MIDTVKNGVYRFRTIRFDHPACTLESGGAIVSVTRKAADLLRVLIDHSGRPVPKDELLRTVWDERFVEETTLTQHIYMLRQALGEHADVIRTIPKYGYQFVGEMASDEAFPLEHVPNPTMAVPPAHGSLGNILTDRRRIYVVAGFALLFVAIAAVFLNASKTAVSNGRNLNELNSGLSDDQDANRSYLLGMSRWDAATEQNLLAAIPEFENAIRLDPTFVSAYSDLADTYALIGHYGSSTIATTDAMNKAAEFAHIALTLDPADSKARTSLALIAARNNQLNESIALLDESIGFNPVNSIPYQRKAWLYASIGQNEKALELMKTAYRIAPRSRSINYGMASLLNIAELPLESLEFSRRWLEFDPQNSNARFKIAESLEMIRGYDEALVELQAITEGDTAYAEAEIVKSRILFKIGQVAAARKTLRIALDGTDPTRYGFQIAQTYKAMGDPRSAVRWMAKNPRRDPNLFSFEF